MCTGRSNSVPLRNRASSLSSFIESRCRAWSPKILFTVRCRRSALCLGALTSENKRKVKKGKPHCPNKTSGECRKVYDEVNPKLKKDLMRPSECSSFSVAEELYSLPERNRKRTCDTRKQGGYQVRTGMERKLTWKLPIHQRDGTLTLVGLPAYYSNRKIQWCEKMMFSAC